MLATEALMVEENSGATSRSPSRATWLGTDEKSGPLCTAVRCVMEFAYRVEGLKPEEELKLRHARQILRSALRQVLRHSDRYFPLQLELITMMIRSLSGFLLVSCWSSPWWGKMPAQFAGLILKSPIQLPGRAPR